MLNTLEYIASRNEVEFCAFAGSLASFVQSKFKKIHINELKKLNKSKNFFECLSLVMQHNGRRIIINHLLAIY